LTLQPCDLCALKTNEGGKKKLGTAFVCTVV
jgi:hypothetical protein